MWGTIPDIRRMKNLIQFTSKYNLLTGTIPDGFYSLPKIDSIQVAGNFLHGTISDEVTRMKSLKGLYLWDNFLSGTIPEQITNLKRLRKFKIHFYQDIYNYNSIHK